ncbi:MAG: DUF4115 domain-containing protein [Candidatus Omnitrophica bacterium]|nr:DUF4115 domain-containing protein [Candidatus Omnitrophota bacterium]
MESTGARLKQLRLERGINLEEVSKKTKIHLNILKAIEEDAVGNFNPVYLKGFLKIYCSFLGVDPKDYSGESRQPAPNTGSVPSAQAKESPGLFSQAASSFKFIPFDKINRTVLKRLAFFALAVACVFLLFNIGKAVSSGIASSYKKYQAQRQEAKLARAEKQAPAAGQKQKTPAPAVSEPAARKQAGTQAQKPKTPVMTGVRLTVQVKENCWIHVKADGKTIFQRVLMKGRSESWEAREKIELSVGNAGAVELQVNGKFLPSIGKKGQVLKNIVITRDGLNVAR